MTRDTPEDHEPPAVMAAKEQAEAKLAERDADIAQLVAAEIFTTRCRSAGLWQAGVLVDLKQSFAESRLLHGLVGQYLALTGASPQEAH